MQVRLLGPVTVTANGVTADIAVQKHRALLATLALRSPGVVTTSELIDALWGDDPPASADKTLQGYVSALRKSFGTELIQTVPGGYQLGPDADWIDSGELEALVSAGRQDLEHGNPAAARGSFTAALALWSSRPLDDLAPSPVKDGQIARLDELHVLAAEGFVVAELQLGHHRDVVPDLERLVAEHPYRELLWQSLMLALYRSERAADALRTYHRLRVELGDELGIEPSASTRALEQQILDQDPALAAPKTDPPNNLRAPLDSFIDRDRERGELPDLIGEHRLVTLLGVGGVGKSRLAREVGAALLPGTPGGVWWVDLAAIPASGSVLRQVAAAMELSTPTTTNLETALLARLRRNPTVLLLDNCEHVREAAASFLEWVMSCAPSVRVLATSRVTLGVAGEQLVAIEPLDISATDDQSVSNAGRLFLDRASQRADMSAAEIVDIEAITDLLGGLPLVIELAAAQCAVKTPLQLLETLSDRSALLSLTGSDIDDPRHASLGHVLSTSVAALEPTLAGLLPRLAVCPGDFDVATASAVMAITLREAEQAMSALLDASLVAHVVSEARQRRFRILQPVREFLSERLDEQDRQCSEAGHATHFQTAVRRFLQDAGTAAEAAWPGYVRLEDHNLRRALSWFEHHDIRAALDFGRPLGLAWMNSGNQVEGRQTLRRLLEANPDAPSRLVAWTEESLMWLELLSGDLDAAVAHNLDAIQRFEQLGDDRGRSCALRSQAHACFLAGADPATTTPIYRRAIDVADRAGLDYARALAQVTFAHALTSWEALDVVDVEAMLSAAESVLRRYGDHANLAHAAIGRALLAFGRGDPATTRMAAEEMLRNSRLANNLIWELGGITVLGVAAHEEGDHSQSRRHLHEAVHLALGSANSTQLGIAFHAVAATSAGRDPAAAARLWGAAGRLTPLWPLFARRYGDWMKPAHDALGDRFDELAEHGARLSIDDAAALADELL